MATAATKPFGRRETKRPPRNKTTADRRNKKPGPTAARAPVRHNGLDFSTAFIYILFNNSFPPLVMGNRASCP